MTITTVIVGAICLAVGYLWGYLSVALKWKKYDEESCEMIDDIRQEMRS